MNLHDFGILLQIVGFTLLVGTLVGLMIYAIGQLFKDVDPH